jgi:hypothetical protein
MPRFEEQHKDNERGVPLLLGAVAPSTTTSAASWGVDHAVAIVPLDNIDVGAPPPPPSCPRLSSSHAVTVVIPLSLLLGCASLALAIWPFSSWPPVASCPAAEGGVSGGTVARTARPWLENAIGSAPGWLRSALLVSLTGQVLSWVFGFKECGLCMLAYRRCCGAGEERARGEEDVSLDRDYHAWGEELIQRAEVERDALKKQVADLQAQQRVGAAAAAVVSDGTLSTALTVDAAPEPEYPVESTPEELQELREWSAQMERQLALARLQKRSLLQLLLTGHGLRPVVKGRRSCAGWEAITAVAHPQASWDAAREDLGLSVRQATGVSITKLLAWHWVRCHCDVIAWLRCPYTQH